MSWPSLRIFWGDAFAKMGIEFPAPLRKIQYWDAMDTYGSDKPDTRIGMELHDVSEVFKQSSFKLFSSAATTEGQYVKAINVKGAGTWPRSQVDKLAEVAAGFGAKGLAWVAFKRMVPWEALLPSFSRQKSLRHCVQRCLLRQGT